MRSRSDRDQGSACLARERAKEEIPVLRIGQSVATGIRREALLVDRYLRPPEPKHGFGADIRRLALSKVH
jgi:hypothetical protein